MIELLRRRSRGFFHEFTFALFNKGRKLDRPIIRNFDVWRGASNAHGGDRGVDLHIAGFRNFARNEGERSLGQIENVELDFPFGSYTNSVNAMRALLDRLNEVPSLKLIPIRPSAPVWTTSPR